MSKSFDRVYTEKISNIVFLTLASMNLYDVLNPVNLPQTTEEAIEIRNGGGGGAGARGILRDWRHSFGTFRKVDGGVV